MVNTARIKSRMRETGHTQKTLSAATGLAQSTLSLKIRNQRPLLLDEAESIAQMLGIQDHDFWEYFLCRGSCAAQQADPAQKPT
jgi:lambda repressor-like predicted transcriptional regulator